ncbi:unnamed protein product [Prunus armeniaca]|uniref:Uncharacterized protein n=1 Tax=Prunus armeniaca TaxID=36596 RepID=A0A6J5WEJ7_PRUAR|nr:unnamed protein product [Prunus armeniaca]
MEVDRDLIDYNYIDYIKKQWSDNNLKYIVMGSCISFYNFHVDYASEKRHYDGQLFLEENKQGGIPVTFMNMDAARTKLSVPKIFRELIEAIVHIHGCGLFHGSLNVYDNYVVVGDQLKLFNVGGRLESLRVQDQHAMKIQDFQEFRDTLKILMQTKITWPERDGFFKCFDEKFDSYEKYVEKLKNHPFLLTPLERLKYITSIYYDDKFGVETKLNEDTNFSKFQDWPKYRHKFEPLLLKVLETRTGKPYGDSPSELLRTRWVGFFDMVHLIN